MTGNSGYFVLGAAGITFKVISAVFLRSNKSFVVYNHPRLIYLYLLEFSNWCKILNINIIRSEKQWNSN